VHCIRAADATKASVQLVAATQIAMRIMHVCGGEQDGVVDSRGDVMIVMPDMVGIAKVR
jgi:hydrogenase maturation factor